MSEADCLRHLQFESFVGRVVFVEGDSIQVRPVNYLADERSIVFCTGRGSVYRALRTGDAVVFEADASRPLDHSGWSVIVRGRAREITDEDELARLRRGPLRSWAASSDQQWMRLGIDEISGVRIPAH